MKIDWTIWLFWAENEVFKCVEGKIEQSYTLWLLIIIFRQKENVVEKIKYDYYNNIEHQKIYKKVTKFVHNTTLLQHKS